MMPVVPYRNFPLADKGVSWSFSAADGNRLIDAGGWALFKRVHTWYDNADGNAPENKSAYKLPHHKYVGDSVKTVWRGVTAAMSRLMQAKTQIPDNDRRGCYNHLSKHYREFDEDPPEFRRYEEEEFRVLLREWGYDESEVEIMMQDYEPLTATSPGRKYGTPTASQLKKINEFAKRPLSKEEVFVFPDKLVGDMIIPDRYIQIHKSLLNVFKEDAKKGVSVLIDHPWAGFSKPKPAIGYGRTFDAHLKKSMAENEEWELLADHYIVRGKEIDGINTDYIIDSIEDGTFFDTSIGWGADTFECSICGNDYRDHSKCDHYTGREYDGKMCYVIAKAPGFLMENSIVFDGAYPGAGVLSSVDNAVEAGEMMLIDDLKNLDSGVTLFHTYSARKGKLLTYARRGDLEKKLTVQGAKFTKGGGDKVSNKFVMFLGGVDVTKHVVELQDSNDGEVKITLSEESLKELPLVKEMIANAVDAAKPDTADPPETYITAEQAKEALGSDVSATEFIRFAKEGKSYLSALRTEAKEWGIRAHGDKYNTEAWDARFVIAGSEELNAFIETFKDEANAAIPAGRSTAPGASKDVAGGDLPDEAYKA